MAGVPEAELDSLWRRIKDELASSVPASTFQLWIEPLQPVAADRTTLYLSAPDTVRTWVERRYLSRILAALRRQGTALEAIGFTTADTSSSRTPPATPGSPRSLPVDPSHSFERFVIGDGNRIAHAAALAVAELPGDAYNPLFLHGSPGLGKTHLLGAIAGYIRGQHPGLSVHYTTAERFTTEFVAALRHDGPERFKQRYRGLDALLIDDVQVLEGKPQTEAEFVHTFNALHAAGKQIVLSSDRPPDALSRLEQRLRDRLHWGLCVPLAEPDLRTRMALAWRLAAHAAGNPPDPDVLREIAAAAPSNVRRLEGAVTRVLAFSSMLGEPLGRELAARALGRDPGAAGSSPGGCSSAAPTIEAIQDAVCSVAGVSRDELLSPRRTPRIARARQLAMYIARQRTSHPLIDIARRFNRDHTTVVHAIRAVSQRLVPGSDTAHTLADIDRELGENPLSRTSADPPDRLAPP